MSALADHLGALIIDAVRKKGGKLSAFSEEVPTLIRVAYGVDVDLKTVEEALEYLRFVGGVEILPSELAGNLLRFRVDSALFFYSDDAYEPSDQTTRQYDQQYNQAQEQLVLKSYYHGGDPWIERVVSRLKSGEFPGIIGVADEVREISVPASDRVVNLNDNQIQEINQSIDTVIAGVAKENSINGDEDLRARFLGQLRAARELVLAGSVRSYLLYETTIRMLGVLMHRYRDQAIGEAAKKLLELLIESVLKS